jgi:hypothetical protein
VFALIPSVMICKHRRVDRDPVCSDSDEARSDLFRPTRNRNSNAGFDSGA